MTYGSNFLAYLVVSFVISKLAISMALWFVSIIKDLKTELSKFFIGCCSVKKGGPSPVSNPVLAALLEKFRELDIPKEILERNMKRATEKGQEAYIEKIYEVCYLHLSSFFFFFFPS